MNQIDNIDSAIIESTEVIVEQAEVVEPDGQIVLPGMPEAIEATESALTLEQIVDAVLESLGWTESTDTRIYQVYKVVNGVLAIIGAQKINKQGVLADYRVTSQMMYQYNSNKMIAKGRVLESIKTSEARTFAIKFCAKFAK